MRTMLEEMAIALKSIGCCSESATRVVGLMLLGVALNVAALHAVDCLRSETHACKRISPIADAARTDIRLVRVVVVGVLKKAGAGGRVLLKTS
jgi:hypothetical protein